VGKAGPLAQLVRDWFKELTAMRRREMIEHGKMLERVKDIVFREPHGRSAQFQPWAGARPRPNTLTTV